MPAARAASATFGASCVKSRRTPLPIVWKCTGNPLAATASHIGSHHGSHRRSCRRAARFRARAVTARYKRACRWRQLSQSTASELFNINPVARSVKMKRFSQEKRALGTIRLSNSRK
jgi:hypothetical protein